MSSTPDHIDELIAMYLAGEAVPEQIKAVERWREASDENRRYFDHLKLIFERATFLNQHISVDTDEAWDRIRKNLIAEKKIIPIRRHESRYWFLKVAAGVIVLITAGVFAFQFLGDGQPQSREVFAEHETLADTLPDGSEVFLNRETKIEYLYNKKGDTHVAKLSGEAYFNIQHGSNKNFIVHAGETFVKDIGTSFNVTAYPDSSTIEVVVEEGEVLFYTKNDPGVYLRANGRGIYDRRTGRFTVGEPRPNVTAYKTRFFSFSNNSLGTVVKTLNGVYNTKIRIDENLKDCKLTVSFNEESVEEIVHVIAETLGLSVSKEKSIIWLRGTGCGEAPLK